MKVLFKNINPVLKSGMADFLKLHNITEAEGGLEISVVLSNDYNIKITKDNNNVTFEVDKEHQIFRCMTLLKERAGEDSFVIEEKRWFDTCGAMFDGSQASSLMTVASVKRMLLYMAGMGFNMAMLYCEDCYELEGEPYWGNMRPRYSIADFKEVDDYAYSLGIELIPCIQTLGHLTDAIKKQVYRDISDTRAVLEVGNPKVNELIEKIIAQMSRTFRTRRIHVGLDEAWDLGFGNYILHNGYRSQTEIMREHVGVVYNLCEKYGMEPMMWSDMFFRGKTNGDYYVEDIDFTEEDAKGVPEKMSLVYWDYYNKEDVVNYMIKHHQKLTDKVIFAGCARNVRSFGTHLEMTKNSTNAALSQCRKEGIKSIFATVWGDDHRESSTFAILPGLQWFAENTYSAEAPSEELVAKRFESCVNVPYDEFTLIDYIDCVPEFNGKNENHHSLSKICMWQDIMMGMVDKNFEDYDFYEHYDNLESAMWELSEKYDEFKIVFEFYSKVAAVLKTKSQIGVKMHKAYKEDNKEELKNMLENVLPDLFDSMSELRYAHRRYFFDEYKPIGWENLDIRYGGALMRIDTAMTRISDYLEGKIEKIEEFEEERLPWLGNLYTNYYNVSSASRTTLPM